MSERQVFVQALTALSTTQKDPLGSNRSEGSKKYKYVQLQGGTGNVNITTGTVVYYNSASAFTVTADLTDVVGSAAGVYVGTSTFTGTGSDQYAWIQIAGRSDALATDVVAGAVGNVLTHVGAADGTLDVSGLVTDPVVATLLDATASAQIIQCNFPE